MKRPLSLGFNHVSASSRLGDDNNNVDDSKFERNDIIVTP